MPISGGISVAACCSALLNAFRSDLRFNRVPDARARLILTEKTWKQEKHLEYLRIERVVMLRKAQELNVHSMLIHYIHIYIH